MNGFAGFFSYFALNDKMNVKMRQKEGRGKLGLKRNKLDSII